jgi:1-deoxy-D-xylulose-5-phosphate reductoisomerase
MKLSVLGATGSIGRSTLDLVARAPERYDVVALVGGSRAAELAAAARAVGAKVAVVADEAAGPALAEALAGSGIACGAGEAAVLEAAARPADMVMAAITGAAGLAPTLAAARTGSTIALANKECLVCAGELFLHEAGKHGARVLPVDSEHNAIFQVLEQRNLAAVDSVLLTASGGPFRTWSLEAMEKATAAEALKHPNWSMGAKITIDSATLMNKGLEVIEASLLFPKVADRLDVVVHPQSLVHGLVAYADGSMLAQLGKPDMRTPIAHCLGWPDRIGTPVGRLDLASIGTLTFEAPDHARFPALGLAMAALRRRQGTTTVLNGANEVAVAAFLEGRIGFLDIARVVASAVERADALGLLEEPGSLEAVFGLDAAARRLATECVHTVAAMRP